jgi:hypothetical protein
MTFEEWLSRTVPLDPAQQFVAKCAWEAATKAEREACAKVCENHTVFFGNGIELRKKMAAAIRMRSNGSGKPTTEAAKPL